MTKTIWDHEEEADENLMHYSPINKYYID